MKIPPFLLERYFAQYEFSAKYLLSPSDCEPLTLQEVLAFANPASRRLWDELWLGYTESQGLPALRQQIAKLYEGISPEQVLTLVPEEGIFIAMNVLLNPGEHVVTTFPGYQSLYQIAESLGCRVSRWLPRRENNNVFFDINDLQDLLQNDTRLLVINFPHNPTGALPERETYQQIIQLADQCGITLFSDEMYRGLEYNPQDRLPSACDLTDKAISLSGVSKTYSLPGLRMGWLTTRNQQLFEQLASFKDYTTICSSAPSEILALIALQNGRQIIERNLTIIKNNLALLDGFFVRHAALFNWYPPHAGSIAFPEYIREENREGTIDRFCADLIAQKGVMLAPAATFMQPGNFFRVGFGRRNMGEALSELEDYLQERK